MDHFELLAIVECLIVVNHKTNNGGNALGWVGSMSYIKFIKASPKLESTQ